MEKVTFDEAKCKGCGLCVTACPKKLIEFDKDRINKKGYHPVAVKNQDLCASCAMCAIICPHVVITINK